MSDKEMQLKRAKTALIAHDYETATRIYKSLIRDDPKDLDLKIQLGNLYVKSGEDELALSCFEEIDKEQPGNVDVLLALGGIYRRLERYDDSIFALEEAIDTGEKGIQISYSLGFTYRQMGKYSSAIECFQSVVDQNPRDVLAFNHLGAIYALQNDHEKAIATYLHGLKLDPNHPVLQLNIAKSMEAVGETKKALSYYEGALRSKPGWTEAIDAYANLLLKDNMVQEADDVVSRALKINPDDVKMHTAMGKVYNRKSVFEHAEAEFKKALSKNESYSPALSGLAYSQDAQGKHSEAAETIQKAMKLSPNDVSILKQSANILLSANYLPAAYEKISHLWKLDKNDVETVNLLGQYYILHKDEDKIEKCFDEIERIKPDYTDVYRDWGKRYFQAGELKDAEDYLNVAVHENAKDTEALLQLAKLYDLQGKTVEALNMLGKAGKIDSFNSAIKKAAERLEAKNNHGSEEEMADADIDMSMDLNSDFADESGFNTEISLADESEEVSPFDSAMGDGNSGQNANADAETPIDFDADAEDDDSIEYDPNRALENLIDTENDSVDKVIPREPSDEADSVPESRGQPGGALPYASSVQPTEARAVPADGVSSPADADVPVVESEPETFDFNQFGSEDLSGDTDDLVSIDEIMSGDPEIDSKNPDEDLVNIDMPVDEDDDSSFSSDERKMNMAEIAEASEPDDYGFEEEKPVSAPRNAHNEFRGERNPDLFKTEDLGNSRVDDEPVYISGSNSDFASEESPSPAPQRQYDSRHQPRQLSDNEYLSLERQIQRVANSADNAAYTANQAWKAAQFANDYAQNAEYKMKNAERKIDDKIDDKIEDKLDGVEGKIKDKLSKIDDRIEDMLEKKFAERLDSRIEDKIKEKIGDDLNSKVSETIDNFLVAPDPELYAEEQMKNSSEEPQAEEPVAEEKKAAEKPDEKEPAETENKAEFVEEKPSEADLMLSKAVETLPSIVAAIANKDVAEEFSTSLDMFHKLREMLEYLPPAKKKQFMTSRNRLMLDYIIAKLSGKPGLFATVSALLASGVVTRPNATDEITSDIDLSMADDENIIALVSSVMQTLRQLCENLEDDYLRDALDSEILGLLEKIKS